MKHCSMVPFFLGVWILNGVQIRVWDVDIEDVELLKAETWATFLY